jgi:hypothetical protein
VFFSWAGRLNLDATALTQLPTTLVRDNLPISADTIVTGTPH